MKDYYPTRTFNEPRLIARQDPVLHGGSQAKGPLTQEQLTHYKNNGFLSINCMFGGDEVEAMRGELDALRNSDEIRSSEISITEPNSGDVRSIFAVQTVSSLFLRVARDARILRIAEQLLGSGVYLHQTRVNCKPGFRGKEFYWHSDFETWHAEDGMPRMHAVSCSIALTDNTEFNGSLMLVPGSHRQFVSCVGRTPDNHYQASLKKQEYGVPDDGSLAHLVKEGGIACPKGKAGSVLFFECNTMHGSNSNISPSPRSNLFFVFNSLENALVEPFAASSRRPWFLGNREPEQLTAAEGRIEARMAATA